MKAIMVTFDSLNKRALPNYGNKNVFAPAFERLNKKCVRYDNCYAGSLPCIPARRELHTGRENFLHSRWTALEPYDDSMPELLSHNGIYTHLTTDHLHYWEDDGFCYHSRYSSFQFSRGQEGDPVFGKVNTHELSKRMAGRRVPHRRIQDAINRESMQETKNFPQAITFQNGLNFIDRNHGADNWFLHIETFDPHEPFFAPSEFRGLYDLDVKTGQEFDWPDYKKLTDNDIEKALLRYQRENMALVSFCSYNLGRLLDVMDKYSLWEDTMLIINTDHGFLLGEHDWLGKNTGPYYNEVANIPLFIYDPRYKDSKNEKVSNALAQTVDLPATMLNFFGIDLPQNMLGQPLHNGERIPNRDFAIWGIFGGQLNCTDGRYVYMKAPKEGVSFNCYSMSGLHFTRKRIQDGDEPYEISMGREFSFSKGYPLLRIGNMGNDFQTQQGNFGNLLFDLENDPKQMHPINNDSIIEKFNSQLLNKFIELDAPEELYGYYGLK